MRAQRHITYRVASLGLPMVTGQEEYVARIADLELSPSEFRELRESGRHLGVSKELIHVVELFGTPPGHTPAGFRVEFELARDGLVEATLIRDISKDADNRPRPTNVLFSADSANPYQIEPVAPLLANLTCNPGIIYDLFLNNPKANVDHRFTNRDEVMAEIGRILGPACDISVELNNPFEPDFGKILDEADRFRDILSPYRVVIKVPHTGPVNAANVGQLLGGDQRLDRRWYEPATEDAFRGHNLALRLREHGYRVNFTLMFEPHQTQLALQAKPYFINSFIRHRLVQSQHIRGLLEAYAGDGDEQHLVALRDYLIGVDMLAPSDAGMDLSALRETATQLLRYRGIDTDEGGDGLDGVRHNLRALRSANLPDTRLIICSMEGERNYPDIDKLLASDEFADMADRVVVTAEPAYLARFASASQVVSYQRRFMLAAAGQS